MRKKRKRMCMYVFVNMFVANPLLPCSMCNVNLAIYFCRHLCTFSCNINSCEFSYNGPFFFLQRLVQRYEVEGRSIAVRHVLRDSDESLSLKKATWLSNRLIRRCIIGCCG